jgi:hypothetical protein
MSVGIQLAAFKHLLASNFSAGPCSQRAEWNQEEHEV